MAGINYAPNYGMTNPWTSNYTGQNQAFPNNQVNPNLNQNQQLYGNQVPQQNFGSFMTVLVQGEAGANAYPVASGNTVMLMDFESGKFWLKSNVNGIPQRLRAFSFLEETQEQTPQAKQNIQSVSREEFDNLSRSVSSISDSVNKLIAELGGTSNE